jgi:hypothetical protein
MSSPARFPIAKSAFLGILLGTWAFPQSMNTGTFLGSVSDASGAAVPGALVRITNESTSFTRQSGTDGEGNYQILQVPAGIYRLEFEKQGSKSAQASRCGSTELLAWVRSPRACR